MVAHFFKHTLRFTHAAKTSRDTMYSRDVWYIVVEDTHGSRRGIGEVAPISGLSCEDISGIENKITAVCKDITQYETWINKGLKDYPSIRFGLETAIMDYESGGKQLLFPSKFTHGSATISINGLVWMGDADFMKKQVRGKIAQGYRCIKLKIGALDFDRELDILKSIRDEFTAEEMEIRVDANGAFNVREAAAKLEKLAELDIHSIEQPIRQKQWEAMADLCIRSTMPIALDEELIGINRREEKIRVLLAILPDYIVLKPSLHGGFAGCREWIEIAESLNIGWWLTSALESNIGLNAIAQWTATLNNPMPQGLGTGQLFTNNIPAPLQIKSGRLYYNPSISWDLSLFG